eukprot:TRINITY_DN12184_c0_g1_i1.p1 TRINITY_DN12184_c0_g1~~TRINITY_DN12184_c0_g1_i1.p1  ORF type:complete len:188 (+),score=42.95 TRINITY_DN12184_c0_g1_i1:272-835(+)
MRQDMGNVIGAKKAQGASKPPHDTVTFLKVILDQESQEQENKVPLYWEDDFRQFLRDKNQTGVLHCMEFCLDVERVQRMIQEEDHADTDRKRQEARTARLKKMQEIGQIYLSRNGTKRIPMKNQEIREELGHDLVNLRLEDMDEVNTELKAAKRDDLVWKAGLDLQYLNYLATKPTKKLQAVLLSIL